MFVGLPEREAMKVQDLWLRGEIGLERSVEVHAPVVVGEQRNHAAAGLPQSPHFHARRIQRLMREVLLAGEEPQPTSRSLGPAATAR